MTIYLLACTVAKYTIISMSRDATSVKNLVTIEHSVNRPIQFVPTVVEIMKQLTVKKSQRNHSFHLVKTVKNQKTIAHNMVIWPLIGHAHLSG